jgi:hypothetical protein
MDNVCSRICLSFKPDTLYTPIVIHAMSLHYMIWLRGELELRIMGLALQQRFMGCQWTGDYGGTIRVAHELGRHLRTSGMMGGGRTTADPSH